MLWRVDLPDPWVGAVDAELADQQVPDVVRRRGGLADDVSAREAVIGWTRAEAVAKVTDTPILLLLREKGLVADHSALSPLLLVTHQIDEVIFTVAAHRRASKVSWAF